MLFGKSSQVNEIERLANWLSDLDAGWWPFLFLRPPKERRINSWVVFKMWLFFAPIYGIGLLLASALLHRTLQSGLDWMQLLFATLSIFVLYRITFAVFWNRRAARLALVRELDWRSRPGNWG